MKNPDLSEQDTVADGTVLPAAGADADWTAWMETLGDAEEGAAVVGSLVVGLDVVGGVVGVAVTGLRVG